MLQTLLGTWLLLAVPFSGPSLAACGSDSVPNVEELQGMWVLVSIDGQTIESETDIYFKIDGRAISGFDGCNNFGGSLDAPDQMRMTQRACASDTPRLPLDLSEPLQQLESSTLDGDTLEVELADEAGTAKFRRPPSD